MATGHPGAGNVLTAMLEDRLFYTPDRRIVIAKATDDGLRAFALIDPVSLKDIGSAPVADLTKIGTNNRLRRFLRTTVARFGLANPDPAVRLDAVTDMIRSLDETTVELLRQRAGVETDTAVKHEIETGLALAALDALDAATRLQAVETLSHRFSQDVRNRLAAMIEPGPDGVTAETDSAVRSAASAAVQRIDSTRSRYAGIRRFFFGLSLGSVLVLATFGVSLILQQLVRSIFSANNRAVETPAWMSGTLQVNEALALTYNRLYIVVLTVIVFAALQLILKRTRTGLEIRAVSQNRVMARAMGIRTEWVDAATFGLGSGIAGVAGVALSQLTNVGPNLGQAYIIDSFMVVVFGGVGNLWGALIGGMLMGIVNKLLEPYSGAVLAKIFVLVALILFIQIRPRGLFPQTGRSAEDKKW